MSNELFTFRDPTELRSLKKTFRNGLVGIIALSVVGGAAYSAKKAIENVGLSTPKISATPSVEKQCSPSEPYARIQLPGGDAEVQVVESIGSAKKTDKLGWLCLRLVSIGETRGTYRYMSLVVTPEINTPIETKGDTGEYSRYTDWVIVEPNAPVGVVASVGIPNSTPPNPASVSVGFDLLYPADSVSGSVGFGDPIISNKQLLPVALQA